MRAWGRRDASHSARERRDDCRAVIPQFPPRCSRFHPAIPASRPAIPRLQPRHSRFIPSFSPSSNHSRFSHPVIPAKSGIPEGCGRRIEKDHARTATRQARTARDCQADAIGESEEPLSEMGFWVISRFSQSRREPEPRGLGGRLRVFIRIRIYGIGGIYRILIRRPARAFRHNRKSRQTEYEQAPAGLKTRAGGDNRES